MKTLRMLHLYLGCALAPLLIVFSLSGAWQVFRWQDTPKDGSYTPPRPLVVVSDFHIRQGLAKQRSVPLQWAVALASLGIIASSVLGVIMALQYAARKRSVWLCLAAGILVPIGLLLAG